MKEPIQLKSLNDLAKKIGLPKYILTRYVFQADSYYKTFRLSKKSGRGQRKINAPSKQLKGIQKWIAHFILNRVELPEQATAYRIGKSIIHNAEPHQSKDFVCNIDLKDFFPSISSKRVTAIFKSLNYPKEVAGALSRLTTYAGHLPQGAPSSPALSNIVLRRLDKRLEAFSRKRQWSYTRYCDDISLSGKNGVSENELEKISQIISDEGFSINKRKMRVSRRNARQSVTGLVVNETPNLTLSVRKKYRAMFHQALLYPEKFTNRLGELQGKLNFFKKIRPTDKKTIAIYQQSISSVRAKMSVKVD